MVAIRTPNRFCTACRDRPRRSAMFSHVAPAARARATSMASSSSASPAMRPAVPTAWSAVSSTPVLLPVSFVSECYVGRNSVVDRSTTGRTLGVWPDNCPDKSPAHRAEDHQMDGLDRLAKVRVAGSNPVVRSIQPVLAGATGTTSWKSNGPWTLSYSLNATSPLIFPSRKSIGMPSPLAPFSGRWRDDSQHPPERAMPRKRRAYRNGEFQPRRRWRGSP